eukprot:1143857-Pelagomonas_calceolata.AAC.2
MNLELINLEPIATTWLGIPRAMFPGSPLEFPGPMSEPGSFPGLRMSVCTESPKPRHGSTNANLCSSSNATHKANTARGQVCAAQQLAFGSSWGPSPDVFPFLSLPLSLCDRIAGGLPTSSRASLTCVCKGGLKLLLELLFSLRPAELYNHLPKALQKWDESTTLRLWAEQTKETTPVQELKQVRTAADDGYIGGWELMSAMHFVLVLKVTFFKLGLSRWMWVWPRENEILFNAPNLQRQDAYLLQLMSYELCRERLL